MYFEDVDLNLKVRSLGKRVIYCPKSVLIHFEGKSSPNQCVIDRLNHQSYRKFHERWGQVLNARAPLGKKNGLSPSPRRTGRVEACGTASAKTFGESGGRVRFSTSTDMHPMLEELSRPCSKRGFLCPSSPQRRTSHLSAI